MDSGNTGNRSVRMAHRSLRQEILAVSLLCGLIALAILLGFQRQFQRVQDLAEQVNVAGQLRYLSQRAVLETRLAARGEVQAQRQLDGTIGLFELSLRALEAASEVNAQPEQRKAIAEVSARWHELKQDIARVREDRRAEPLDGPTSAHLTKRGDAVLAAAQADIDVLLPRLEAPHRLIQLWVPLTFLALVGIWALAYAHIHRRLLAPLQRIGLTMDRLAAGEFTTRVAVDASSVSTEIWTLVQQINAGADTVQRLLEGRTDAMARIADSEERYRTLWEISPDAIIAINERGLIQFANPAVAKIFGYAQEELQGQDICILIPPHLHAAHRKGLARYIATGDRNVSWRGVEMNALDKRGLDVAVELTFSELTLSDQQRVFIGTLRDIRQRKQHEAELQQSATHDSLTGLPNRLLLFDRVEQALHAAHRQESTVGILCVGLDNFKYINDSLGHDWGDALLREAGKRLQACVREIDTVARVGGDEFVLLLTELDKATDLDTVAQRVLASIAEPFQYKNSEAFVSASIGACSYPGDGATRAELLQHADIAMYRAKESGRNNCQHYMDDMQARYRQRASLEVKLRHAIEDRELVLYYQPQVDLRTQKLVGAEALVRWSSPTLGLVPPSQFIPLAEETGLIHAIGTWVMEQACRDAAQWRGLAGLSLCRVAVNLSARQFSGNSLLETVAHALRDSGLPASGLELEITESLLMRDPMAATSMLQQLRELDCHVALDDFGTGYSSLAYLRHFPLDALKIDKSLVQDSGIVRAVVQLAQTFQVQTVAEGVESSALRQQLAEQGCDIVQGFEVGRPMPLPAFLDFAERWKGFSGSMDAAATART